MKHLYTVAFVLGILIGCEHTPEDVELPFEERLVVYGDVESAVRFERTLPLNTVWTEEAAILQDVCARIIFEGVTYPLRLDSVLSGVYRGHTLPDRGGDVEFQAEWKGKKVTARVRKPALPQIDTLWFRIDSSTVPPTIRCGGTFLATGNAVYYGSIGVRIDSLRSYRGWDFPNDENEPGHTERIHLSADFPLPCGAIFREIRMEVGASDRAYRDYQLSSGYSSLPPTSLFSGPIRSNIRGDGIGVVWADSYYGRSIVIR